MKTLASRLNQALTTANLTASDLARQVGVSHVAIGHILSGRNADVRSQLAARIAAALKCDLTWLIIGSAVLPALPADTAKSHLKAIGLTQEQAAHRLNVTGSYLNRVLNGHLKSQSLVNRILNLTA